MSSKLLTKKPPFENYGRNNTNGATANGFLYGNYLFTHNVNPHKCPN